jgi:SAM-dependent methyltransferase
VNPTEMHNQFEPDGRPSLPVEVIERGKREKEFYDRYSDPSQISDEVLVVPKDFDNLDLPPEIARLVPSLPEKTVCDFGCGYGLTSAFFALRGAQTFALDVSETNVSIAKRTACVNEVADRVFLQVAQGEDTGYPKDSFDLIFGKGVLHHLATAPAAQEMYRILKPGGAAVFFEPFGENKLLEWARRCPLRSSEHRHTRDERNILYSDLTVLASYFDRVTFRETGLVAMAKTLCRKVEVGMVAIPRGGRTLDALANWDRWAFAHLPILRRLAPFVVICMLKDGGKAGTGEILRELGQELHHSRAERPITASRLGSPCDA